MRKLLYLVAFLFSASATYAQSGKIAGQVTDAASSTALPGVNVIIEGTQQGATTDAEGYYTILNVRPGSYTVRASFIGYTPQQYEDVRVNTNLTSEVDFTLQEESVDLDAIVVTSERPIVQRDVSANIANLNAAEMENLPVSGVDDVINLQAGIEPGLQVRGGGLNEVSFLVDGMSTSGGRTSEPFINISFTAVDEVQVQTGGFNAEYGNLRSGLINVVTKPAPRDRYTVDAVVRYSAPSQKHFGELPSDRNGYYLRPYFDPAVAFEGTQNGAWDQYTQYQYPDFLGFNSFAEVLKEDDDPNNDYTPQQLQELYAYRVRKDVEVTQPEYNLDATIGGPIPGGESLGNLRFLASYRQTNTPYIVPQQRAAYQAYTGQFKVTSDLATGLQLTLNGLYAKELGMNTSNAAWSANFSRGEMPQYPWDDRASLMAPDIGGDQVFRNNSWALSDVNRLNLGGELTHALNANTFYEVRFQRQFTDYFTHPGPERDASNIVGNVAGIPVDEAPLPWDPQPGGQGDPLGGAYLGGGTLGRDTSEVVKWMGQFDITSQINRFMQAKAGVSYEFADYNVRHGVFDAFHVHHANPKFRWNRQPHTGGAYAQTKLEFQGMVANLGLRMDYFHAGGEWFIYEPYSRAFTAKEGADNLGDNLEQTATDRQFYLSPRVGVSFPVTVNSKFYFNYGHFRQVLDPRRLFTVEASFFSQTTEIGNPNHPMPRTVAYELGYEQNAFDMFLIRVAGFYRDIKDQPRSISYVSIDRLVNYDVAFPYNYEDNRGVELTVSKIRGRWLRGFVNYTFLVRKEGDFAYDLQDENRVNQRTFENISRNFLQRPQPEPYARINLELLTPLDYGPSFGSLKPLADWRLSFLGAWRSGDIFTYTGGSDLPGVRDNMKWADYWNLDMRISKNVDFGDRLGRIQIFADISNVLNLKRLHRQGAWAEEFNFERYMESLHYSRDTFAELEDDQLPNWFIEGDDRPGTYRSYDTEWVPIEIFPTLENVTNANERALYFIRDEGALSGTYWQYDAGSDSFRQADQGLVDQVMDDKAYIVMPNETFYAFLNPRNIFFGLRLSF